MPQFFTLAPPPGVYRRGVEYQAKGRWWDANLVRWRGEQLGPIGGWRARSPNAAPGKARALLPWRDNANNRWIGIGTHGGLHVQNTVGQLFDITPAGFVAGRADESLNIGFGAGPYGSGAYGVPRSDVGSVVDALVW